MTQSSHNPSRKSKILRRFSISLIVMIVLTPLGVILPARLGAGSAWGEWSVNEVTKMVGYKPAGMAQYADRWKAPLPDYGFQGDEKASLKKQSLSYVFSAIIGVLCVAGGCYVIGRMASRRDQSENS